MCQALLCRMSSLAAQRSGLPRAGLRVLGFAVLEFGVFRVWGFRVSSLRVWGFRFALTQRFSMGPSHYFFRMAVWG